MFGQWDNKIGNDCPIVWDLSELITSKLLDPVYKFDINNHHF